MYQFPIGVILESFRKPIPEAVEEAAKLGAKGLQVYATRTRLAHEDMTPAQVAFYEDALHLNKPLAVQFGFYLRSLLDGTLGYSYKKDAAVSALITQYS